MNPGEICGCPYELSCIRQYQASSFPSQLLNLYIDGINLSECIPEGSAACLESSVTSGTWHAESHECHVTALESVDVIP